MTGIADTGFLVALANTSDEHHAWAASLAEKIREPLKTCESVLMEAAFHLGDSGRVLALLERGSIVLAFDCGQHVARLRDLARRYANRRPTFADLCLIRMSELHPDLPVITVDRENFRVYRRNGREVIPIVCPPVA